MIGASGAIAGVMGAYFVLYPQSRVLTAVFTCSSWTSSRVPAIFFLGIWFLMQFFSGVGSLGADAAGGGVAFWAHVVGFAVGGFVGARGAFGGTEWGDARQVQRFQRCTLQAGGSSGLKETDRRTF